MTMHSVQEENKKEGNTQIRTKINEMEKINKIRGCLFKRLVRYTYFWQIWSIEWGEDGDLQNTESKRGDNYIHDRIFKNRGLHLKTGKMGKFLEKHNTPNWSKKWAILDLKFVRVIKPPPRGNETKQNKTTTKSGLKTPRESYSKCSKKREFLSTQAASSSS